MIHIPNPDDDIWYCNAPIGAHGLSDRMTDISKLSGLSRIYSNHSIRATCITLLDDSGIEARHIMRVSGHRNEASIRSYASCLDDKKKTQISDCISDAIAPKKLCAPAVLTRLPNATPVLPLVDSASHNLGLGHGGFGSTTMVNATSTVVSEEHSARRQLSRIPALTSTTATVTRHNDLSSRREDIDIPTTTQNDNVFSDDNFTGIGLDDNGLLSLMNDIESQYNVSSVVEAPTMNLSPIITSNRVTQNERRSFLQLNTCNCSNCTININYKPE